MLNGKQQATLPNIGLGWDGVNLLHCSSCGDVLWICNQNCAGNSNDLATAGQSLHSQGLLFYPHPAGREWARGQERRVRPHLTKGTP